MNPLIYILLGILIVLLLMLIIVRKKVKKDIEKNQQRTIEKMQWFSKKIKSPKESLLVLNHVAKDFFKAYLRNKSELTYREMSAILRNKKKDIWADFCDEMDYHLYSGKEVSRSEALTLINSFISIVRTEEEKKKETKK